MAIDMLEKIKNAEIEAQRIESDAEAKAKGIISKANIENICFFLYNYYDCEIKKIVLYKHNLFFVSFELFLLWFRLLEFLRFLHPSRLVLDCLYISF